MELDTVLGIDVGGTSIKAALITVEGSVLASESVATPGDANELTAAVIALAEILRRPGTVAAAVVCPGVIEDGVVRYAVNLAWRDEPLRRRLHDALALPVVLARDVAAAALAESSRATADHVLFVALGTGIACAHVVGGVVRAGASGRAGEIGHSPVHPDGEPCACGQRGCLEAYASAAAIARRYGARTGRTCDAADVAASVDSDADAAAVWQQAVDALALALETDTLVNDPGLVVLGGGLAEAGDALLEPVRAALADRLTWRAPPPIVRAALGPAAGLLGAAELARRELLARAREHA